MQYDEIDRRLTHLEEGVGTLKDDVGTLKNDVGTLKVDVAYLKGAVDRLSWLMPLMMVVGMALAGAIGALR
jgi:hypothetical protein